MWKVTVVVVALLLQLAGVFRCVGAGGAGVLQRDTRLLVILDESFRFDCKQLFNRTESASYSYEMDMVLGGEGPKGRDMPGWLSGSRGAVLRGVPTDKDVDVNRGVWVNVTMQDDKRLRERFRTTLYLDFNHRPTFITSGGSMPVGNKKIVDEFNNRTFEFSYKGAAEDVEDKALDLKFEISWNETWIIHDKREQLLYGDIPLDFNTSFQVWFRVRDSLGTAANRVIRFYPNAFVLPRLRRNSRQQSNILLEEQYNPQIAMPMEEVSVFDLRKQMGIVVNVGALEFKLSTESLPAWLTFDPDAQVLRGSPVFMPNFDFDDIQIPIRVMNTLGGSSVSVRLNIVVSYGDLFLYYFGMYLLTGVLSFVAALLVYFIKGILAGPLIAKLHEYRDTVKKIEQREEVVFYGLKNNIDRKLVIYGCNRMKEWLREHRVEHIHSFFTGMRQFLWNTTKARVYDFFDPLEMIGTLLSDVERYQDEIAEMQAKQDLHKQKQQLREEAEAKPRVDEVGGGVEEEDAVPLEHLIVDQEEVPADKEDEEGNDEGGGDIALSNLSRQRSSFANSSRRISSAAKEARVAERIASKLLKLKTKVYVCLYVVELMMWTETCQCRYLEDAEFKTVLLYLVKLRHILKRQVGESREVDVALTNVLLQIREGLVSLTSTYKFGAVYYMNFAVLSTLFAPIAWVRAIRMVSLIPSFPRYWYAHLAFVRMTAPYCLSSFHGNQMTQTLTRDASRFKDLRYAVCYISILRDYAVVCREFGLQENAQILLEALRAQRPKWCLARKKVIEYVQVLAEQAADEAERVQLNEDGPREFQFVTLQTHAERYLAAEIPEGFRSEEEEEHDEEEEEDEEEDEKKMHFLRPPGEVVTPVNSDTSDRRSKRNKKKRKQQQQQQQAQRKKDIPPQVRDRLDILNEIAATAIENNALGTCQRCHDAKARVFCVECNARYCSDKDRGSNCDVVVHERSQEFRTHRRFEIEMLAAPGSVEAKMEAKRRERELQAEKIKAELDKNQLRLLKMVQNADVRFTDNKQRKSRSSLLPPISKPGARSPTPSDRESKSSRNSVMAKRKKLKKRKSRLSAAVSPSVSDAAATTAAATTGPTETSNEGGNTTAVSDAAEKNVEEEESDAQEDEDAEERGSLKNKSLRAMRRRDFKKFKSPSNRGNSFSMGGSSRRSMPRFSLEPTSSQFPFVEVQVLPEDDLKPIKEPELLRSHYFK